MSLRVGIIGAGIGGLSAAIGLRRAGAQVEIFERSTFTNEVGAALTITPNGSRILDSWGFDAVKAGIVEAVNMRIVHAHSLENASVEDFSTLQREFGATMGFYHRVDLHSRLREMAESSDAQPGEAVAINLGNGVVDVDCATGVLALADGTEVTKDLVVIADGIKSNFVSKVTGKEEPARDMGWSAYRCLIPMEDIMNDEHTRAIFENQPPGYWAPFYIPKAFYLVSYPCRDNKTLNIVLRHTTQPQDNGKVDWHTPATHDDVLALMKDYHPSLSHVIKKAPDIKMYKLLRREPLETYSRGRAVLLGDAAHTVLPIHAQGAVMAIEEAAALELLFKGVTDPNLVASRLELYGKVLKKHIHVNQYLGDTVPGFHDHYRQKAEEVWGDGLFPYTAYNFTAPVRQFFYSYDVRHEITKGMEEAGL
ncbi:uncharacterized protein BCR38DRAFT_480877 [Pseudomassariella vexata]|uniref:FAD-binding domain-containing protein n=1 Tax=Pseudomassariella vexata TaxID=1141098 RepID=A0A1Y2EFY6_9PEZI|nr:uncharacterized protein BCR38DRAFT_480877 [Pseudomassariella vexata]ORY69705.1 hypothetical protein BCR38DRAFT_480877 [Pseudomassariella vexata]